MDPGLTPGISTKTIRSFGCTHSFRHMARPSDTKNRRPLELIFYEAFPNKLDALRREAYFKTTKGKTTLKQMIKEFLK
ncbi:MAG: GIY-YIG nuclease family protein [Patescibacteria group bacterium]